MDISDEFNESHQNVQEQLIKQLFSLFIRHRWTLTSLEDTAKLMNSMPGAEIILPTTKYRLIKQLLNMSNITATQNFFCQSCKTFTKIEFSNDSKTKKCVNCGKKLGDNFFVSFNLREQLVRVIDSHYDSIKIFRDSMKNNENVTDVYGSDYMKKIMVTNDNIYSLTLNTDGVAIVQSKGSSLWPVLLTCNFLPPQIRFKDKNILVAALYYGNTKPNMHELLRPLAEEFETLSEGIFVQDIFCNVFITNASLDLPAKCDVSKMVTAGKH